MDYESGGISINLNFFFLNSDVQFEKEEEEEEEESLNSRYRDKIGKLTVDYIAILHGK